MHNISLNIKRVPHQQNYTILLLWYFFASFLVNATASTPFYKATDNLVYTDVFSFDFEKGSHTIQLGSTADGIPQYYYTNLITPVCDDSICEILHLEMFWDLLGNYMGFDTLPGYALTKYDHVKFNAQEYEHLHQILLDQHSALGDLQISDLVTNKENHSTGVIDAISGATNINISQSVVKGGVYSCYILWHIANPLSKKEILHHTNSMMNDNLRRYLLRSDEIVYQKFVLEEIREQQYHTFQDEIFAVLKSEEPEMTTFLIDKMPDSFLGLDKTQMNLSLKFSTLTVVSRFKYLQRLLSCRCISNHSVNILSSQVPEMSYMQVQTYTDILRSNKSKVSHATLANLQLLVKDSSYQYAFIIEEYLKGL